MPVAKLKAITATDTMKSNDGNDSLDTFFKQTVGNDPSLSFSRTGDSSVQLYQLLHALKQQDLPGWPLLSPVKVQMQKCEKCSREFCSPINYRRHKRVHRRSLNVDKECHKRRDLLGAFWDKLSLDEVKEIVSFNDVSLEEVPGSSITRELMSFIRKPGFCTLPQVYARAGSALMDLIHARPSRLPISSQELFRILDDASERTFLCAGTAESVQKYVFDGEAGKIGLEMNNLVACTSLLMEQKLVKAWLADKDAEALRCQKLLVEEEEAAQNRKAELLERKRQKKLRQKEQKGKDQSNGEKTDLKVIADTLQSPPSAETSSSPSAYESSSDAVDIINNHVSLFEPAQVLSAEEDVDIKALFGLVGEHLDSGTCESVVRQTMQGNGRRRLVNARWQVPKSPRGGRNGFHANQNLHPSKLEPTQKHGSHTDPRPGLLAVHGNKVWTRKPKSESNGETFKTRLQETINQTDQNTKCELMIGAVTLTLGNCTVGQQGDVLAEDPANSCSLDYSTAKKKNSIQETHTKADSVQSGSTRPSVKLWRPVSRNEAGGSMPVQSGGNDRTLPSESCRQLSAMDENGSESGNNTHPFLEESVEPEGLLFSSRAAKAFLAQRWNEAIAAEHVKLIISQQAEPPERRDANDDCQVATDFPKRSILGNAENRLAIAEAIEYSATRSAKAKFRPKPEKSSNKMKYIPKQRTVT